MVISVFFLLNTVLTIMLVEFCLCEYYLNNLNIVHHVYNILITTT